LKKTKALLSVSKRKIVTNCFIHPKLLILSKTSFKNFARDSVFVTKKKIFRSIGVIHFFGTNYSRFTLWTIEVISYRMLYCSGIVMLMSPGVEH